MTCDRLFFRCHVHAIVRQPQLGGRLSVIEFFRIGHSYRCVHILEERDFLGRSYSTGSSGTNSMNVALRRNTSNSSLRMVRSPHLPGVALTVTFSGRPM